MDGIYQMESKWDYLEWNILGGLVQEELFEKNCFQILKYH